MAAKLNLIIRCFVQPRFVRIKTLNNVREEFWLTQMHSGEAEEIPNLAVLGGI